MRAIGVAVSALAADPNPPAAFVRGDYRRLKVGDYRIMYVVEVDVITIERADRLISRLRLPAKCTRRADLSGAYPQVRMPRHLADARVVS